MRASFFFFFFWIRSISNFNTRNVFAFDVLLVISLVVIVLHEIFCLLVEPTTADEFVDIFD